MQLGENYKIKMILDRHRLRDREGSSYTQKLKDSIKMCVLSYLNKTFLEVTEYAIKFKNQLLEDDECRF